MHDTDIYPVGLLADWQQFVHAIDQADARRTFRNALRRELKRIKAGHWRGAKNWFNGYLAEPREFPPGVTRCGTGWTRGRAYRDLQRHIAAAGRPTVRSRRSRPVLALVFAIACALGGSLAVLAATAPHHQPHDQPYGTADTSTSVGACQEGPQP